MKKKNSSNLAVAVGAAALLSAGSASAATLNFIGFIDSYWGETAVEPVVALNPIYHATYVPIATTARGYSGNGMDQNIGSAPYAYLDGNQAGIGVCRVLTTNNQCAPAEDDNVTTGEILGLSWGSAVVLQSLSFRGEDHPGDPPFAIGELFSYSTNGGANWFTKQLINAKNGVVDFGGLQLGVNQEILLAFNNEQFYVSAAEVTAVPIPAAAWLLGSGLAGLFAVGRRRRAGTVAA